MRKANATRARFRFRRDRLPSPEIYYAGKDARLIGRGEWRSARCPFHDDTRPSLRVNVRSGGFRCMVCGAHGGDVLAFHMQLTGLPFIEAAKALGVWERTR